VHPNRMGLQHTHHTHTRARAQQTRGKTSCWRENARRDGMGERTSCDGVRERSVLGRDVHNRHTIRVVNGIRNHIRADTPCQQQHRTRCLNTRHLGTSTMRVDVRVWQRGQHTTAHGALGVFLTMLRDDGGGWLQVHADCDRRVRNASCTAQDRNPHALLALKEAQARAPLLCNATASQRGGHSPVLQEVARRAQPPHHPPLRPVSG
jgi:hypothetical protein